MGTIIRTKDRREERTRKVISKMSPGNKKKPPKSVCPCFGPGFWEINIFDKKGPKTWVEIWELDEGFWFFRKFTYRLNPYQPDHKHLHLEEKQMLNV